MRYASIDWVGRVIRTNMIEFVVCAKCVLCYSIPCRVLRGDSYEEFVQRSSMDVLGCKNELPHEKKELC